LYALGWTDKDFPTNRSYAILFFYDDRKVAEKAQWHDSTESIGDKIRLLAHPHPSSEVYRILNKWRRQGFPGFGPGGSAGAEREPNQPDPHTPNDD
jgi:hypothetical protein